MVPSLYGLSCETLGNQLLGQVHCLCFLSFSPFMSKLHNLCVCGTSPQHTDAGVVCSSMLCLVGSTTGVSIAVCCLGSCRMTLFIAVAELSVVYVPAPQHWLLLLQISFLFRCRRHHMSHCCCRTRSCLGVCNMTLVIAAAELSCLCVCNITLVIAAADLPVV